LELYRFLLNVKSIAKDGQEPIREEVVAAYFKMLVWMHVRSEVLTAVIIKIVLFWDVMPCSSGRC
jgi:hypothetical protein